MHLSRPLVCQHCCWEGGLQLHVVSQNLWQVDIWVIEVISTPGSETASLVRRRGRWQGLGQLTGLVFQLPQGPLQAQDGPPHDPHAH